MRRTRFVNAQTLFLATTVNATNTSVVLDDATSLPTEGDFNISVEDEIMLVTHRTANTLTVVRAQDNTTGASHTSGQLVGVIATKTGMDKVMYDSGLPYTTNPHTLSVNASSFSWLNQGTSSLVDSSWGGVTMVTQNASPHSLRCAYIAAPSEPWTLIINILLGPNAETGISGGSHAGIVLSDSGSTKLETLTFRRDSDLSWFKWISPTTYAATFSTYKYQMNPKGIWLKMVNSAFSLYSYASCDGVNWFQIGLGHSKGVWLDVNGPDRVGFYYANHQTNGEMAHLNAWLLT